MKKNRKSCENPMIWGDLFLVDIFIHMWIEWSYFWGKIYFQISYAILLRKKNALIRTRVHDSWIGHFSQGKKLRWRQRLKWYIAKTSHQDFSKWWTSFILSVGEIIEQKIHLDFTESCKTVIIRATTKVVHPARAVLMQSNRLCYNECEIKCCILLHTRITCEK